MWKNKVRVYKETGSISVKLIDKAYIRNIHKNKRLSMSKLEKKEKDENIFKKVISLKIFEKKDIILSYISTEIEVDTINIISYFLNKNKRIAVPLCIYETGNIEFYYIDSLKHLKPGRFSILEPFKNSANLVLNDDIDRSVCIVPGMVYSFSGHRIGYGKGYYDRFLYGKKCFKIGLCYDFNLIENVLNNYLDVCVDTILTENKVLNIV